MQVRTFGKLFSLKRYFLFKLSKKKYISYLRERGLQIGHNFQIRGSLRSISIDLTRPSLITIGDNVTINKNFTLFTHDFVSGVFVNRFHDFVASSGPVVIGNNVRFGVNCIILKGVSIGDNCFVAAGSVVTKSFPSNSIIGGVPAKLLCSLDDYYYNRKVKSVEEAFVYARSIVERFKRKPVVEDFWEEFPLFVDARNINLYIDKLPIKKQLGDSYDIWLEEHKAMFECFEDFLNAADIK